MGVRRDQNNRRGMTRKQMSNITFSKQFNARKDDPSAQPQMRKTTSQAAGCLGVCENTNPEGRYEKSERRKNPSGSRRRGGLRSLGSQ